MKALLSLVTMVALLVSASRPAAAQEWPGEAARQRINEALDQNEQPGAIPPTPAEQDYIKYNSTAPAEMFATSNSDDSCGRFAGCCDGLDPSGYKYQWAPDKWTKVGAAVRASTSPRSMRLILEMMDMD